MIITGENYKDYIVGGKAQRLFQLREQGYPVTAFFCTGGQESEEENRAYLQKHFSKVSAFSVRSSASVEDGSQISFAGQFETFLGVKPGEVAEYIAKVAGERKDESLIAYCREQNMDPDEVHMTVIVQEMINADKSGVVFTSNPQGLLNEMVVVAGKGTGENVVEDKVDVITYYYNVTDKISYYEKQPDAPMLGNKELQELIELAESVRDIYGFPCDIEYAFEKGKLYLLQVRPITTLPSGEEPIVLDNSNIVESYPGITLPLTQSFIREVYYKVFKRVLLRLTGKEQAVEQIDDILRNMVDVANGRVYYRISNWYDVIMFLPFSGKIIPIWQEMLGVQNKQVTSHVKNKIGTGTRVRTFFSFMMLLFTSPGEMRKLDDYFRQILDYFHTLNIEDADNGQLIAYYKDLEQKVTDRWDITLVNDMYSFLFTALLKARLKAKKIPDYEVVTNRYISRIADIESMKPIRQLAALAKRAKDEGREQELLALRTNAEALEYIGRQDAYAEALRDYIEEFGDRNLEELKLESKTFRTDPILLIQRIVQYAEENLEIAEKEKEKDVAGGITGWLAGKAALGIKNREASRMNRSRLYGIMRLLMLRIGENLTRAGRLQVREDIFWLFFEEIEKATLQEPLPLQEIIERRKTEYQGYGALPAYSRLIFAGSVRNKTPGIVCENLPESEESLFRGVACSGGVAEGEVLLVEHPTMQTDTVGKILVTKMTDPGWVFLIADAKAVVAEKGSLLSHTAIISRELGKPAVVSVRQITKLLKTGDFVRVDGDKGEITILNANRHEKNKTRQTKE